jgi:uncharacterized membrane protein YhhN
MNNLKFCIYSIPFFVASAVHIFACITDNEKLRVQTKPFLMPLLALSVFLYSFMYLKALPIQRILLICAIFFGWIGDLYLLANPSDSRFAKGALFFLIGHFFYIAILIILFNFTEVSVFLASIIIFIYICLLFLTLKNGQLPKGAFGIELIIYAAILSASSCIALILLTTYLTTSSKGSLAINGNFISQIFIIFIGGIFFLLSDATLSFATFNKRFKQCDTLIMSTYLVAQFLLAFGISLC